MERYYNARVRKKNLIKRDLVLRNAQSTVSNKKKASYLQIEKGLM